MLVEPAKPRYLTERRANELRITIPGERSGFAIFFVSVWLVGWAVGELVVLGVVGRMAMDLEKGDLSIVQIIGGLIALVWLVGWSLGGVTVFRSLLRLLVGRETIILGHERLAITLHAWIFTRRREYRTEKVSKMRLITGLARRRQMGGSASMKFDYGADTIEFAYGLSEAEAQALMEELSAGLSGIS